MTDAACAPVPSGSGDVTSMMRPLPSYAYSVTPPSGSVRVRAFPFVQAANNSELREAGSLVPEGADPYSPRCPKSENLLRENALTLFETLICGVDGSVPGDELDDRCGILQAVGMMGDAWFNDQRNRAAEFAIPLGE